MGASTRTPAQFRDDVLTAFSAAWVAAGQPIENVAWDNVEFNTSNKDFYVFAGLSSASGELASLGTGNQIQVRRFAIFAANINVRHNMGMALSDELSEVVLNFLESAKLTGIRFRNIGIIQTGRFDEWFQVTATAEVDYDSFRTV